MAQNTIKFIEKVLGRDESGAKNQNVEKKVKKLYGREEYNPFLDKNGNIFNKYMDYQRVLDNPNISDRAKKYITEATGLTPKISANTGVVRNPSPVKIKTDRMVTPAGIPESELPQSDSGIVETAKKYIGTPYVWGGDNLSEGGMDCSGFVFNALKDAGYKVGRTTAEGYRSGGTAVSKSNMQPGDLVFFGKDGKATHIGIYMGDGKMIHSSGGSSNTKSNPGKGVSIANVDYRSDFLEARRY